MIDFLIKWWWLLFLLGIGLNIPFAIFFFYRFARGAGGAFSGATEMLGKSLDVEVEEGKEVEALAGAGLKVAGGFFGPFIKNMLPALAMGIPLALLYLGALVGFVGMIIRAAVGG